MPRGQTERDNTSNNRLKKTRRKFLTLTGIGAGAALAGCAGSDGGNESGGGGGNESGSSARFDGVTIEVWDWFTENVGRDQWFKDTISQFESDTGATVQTSFGGDPYGGWPEQIRQGSGPDMFAWTPGHGYQNPDAYYTMDDLEEDYPDQFGDDTLGDLEWLRPSAEFISSSVPDVDIVHIPILLSPRSPVMARWDFVQDAGLEGDFPPDNFDDATQFAKDLQENSEAEFGFQVPGAPGDALGFMLSQMADISDDIAQSTFTNQEMTEVQVDNDAWRGALQRFKTLLDENVLAPDTPSLAGPDISGQFATTNRYGQINPEPKHHTNVIDSDPSLVEQGRFRWYPIWGQDKANMAAWSYNVVPQSETNQEQRRQEAAIHLLSNYFMSEEFHANLPQGSGFIPSKKDSWDAAQEAVQFEDQHHWFQTNRTMSNNIGASSFKFGNKEHPSAVPAIGEGEEAINKFLLGEISAEEATSRWAERGTEAMGF